MTFGIIGFDHYKVSCIIGVLDEERINPQDLYLDLRIEYDFLKAVLNDSFKEAICYEKLSYFCKDFAQKKKYYLIETLAVELLEALFENFNLTWCSIKIKKPSAIKDAGYACVEFERGNKR